MPTNDTFLEFHTERVHVRRLQERDAPALVTYRALSEVAKYQSWDAFTLEDASRLIAGQLLLAPNTPGTWFQLAIVEAASGQVIGDCGLHFRSDDLRQVELGVTLAPSHQGRGLATDALRCVLCYLFETLDKHRVSAVTDAENSAAAALFHRLGFRQEGHFVEHTWFKGAWGSEFLFALLQREWRERRR